MAPEPGLHRGYRRIPKEATIPCTLVSGFYQESRTARQKETITRERFSDLMIMVTIAAASGIPMSITRTSAQAQAVSATALKTPWGEPDLQGIWTDEFDTPLQRPPKYGNQEVFSEAQREELDKERSALYGQERPADRGTEFDVARAYNHAVFLSNKHVGARTSLIIDPPNGRIPQLTPEAGKIAAGDREFRLALLQSTQT
jgi:hypothetical protein